MTQTLASPAGDTPLFSYIDMTANHPTASSLSYTMHPPYVAGQISRRTFQNTLSPSSATPEARSAATQQGLEGKRGINRKTGGVSSQSVGNMPFRLQQGA